MLADGSWGDVPEWMTSRERCANAELIDAPFVSVVALTEVKHYLQLLSSASARKTLPPAATAEEVRDEERRAGRNTAEVRLGGLDSVGGSSERKPKADSGDASPSAATGLAARKRGGGR
jgi:hypothetical protein